MAKNDTKSKNSRAGTLKHAYFLHQRHRFTALVFLGFQLDLRRDDICPIIEHLQSQTSKIPALMPWAV